MTTAQGPETPVTRPVLHGYFRSSTAYRVRLALALKGIAYDQVAHHLRKGEQRAPGYLALNPQGLVPSLVWSDGSVLTQSLAILEYLDEIVPEPPLLPPDPLGRARVRGLAQMIACDLHPINNLRVLQALRTRFGADDAAVADWFRHWVATTFAALETRLAREPETGPFCHGDAPGLADVCLLAQVANNRRFGVDATPYPVLQAIADRLAAWPGLAAAAPAAQPDAEA